MFLGVVNPMEGSSIGLEIVKLLGGGFDSTPGRTRVYFGEREALAVQVPTDARIYARTPVGVLVDAQGRAIEEVTVDVRVDVLDDLGNVVSSSTKAAAYTYRRTVKPTLSVVTAAVIRELRSIVGNVRIDVDPDYTEDGVLVLPAQLPVLLMEGPNFIRDEFRTGRDVPIFSQGNNVPRLIPPWARTINFEWIWCDKNRGSAVDITGHITRWVDSGPKLFVQGRELEVYEDLNNQARAVQIAGQDYTNGRVVAYRGGFTIAGYELPGETWDIAAEMQDPQLALEQQ